MRPPPPSTAAVSARMRVTGRRDTAVELAVRKRLHRRGLRYRVDARPEATLRTRADVVFPRARVAVFIDGCFWHGCPDHFRLPRANREWWREKIEANRQRDRAASQGLVAKGWTVLRFWEHQDPSAIADAIEQVVRLQIERRSGE